MPTTIAEQQSRQAGFKWDVPATFNFGADVVDRFAEDPERVALIETVLKPAYS